MKLVLCDDNRILCEALAAALKPRGHTVLAIATTPADGIATVADLRPDACLLDLRFPGPVSGLAAIRTLRTQHPGTAVVILSGVTDPAIAMQVLEAGVAGFIRKDQNIAQIADALDVIGSGGLVLDAVRAHPAKSPMARRPGEHPPYQLTGREKEVLRRITAGQGTAQMSREMNIATSTLRSYVKSVLFKLGAHTRLQAAATATREGLLHGLGRAAGGPHACTAGESIPHQT
ncbi:MAG: response regulator [Streptosporangiales bacterium]